MKTLSKGWLEAQLAMARAEVASWPQWKQVAMMAAMGKKDDVTRAELKAILAKVPTFDIDSGGYCSGHSLDYPKPPIGEYGKAGDYVTVDDLLEAFGFDHWEDFGKKDDDE